MSTASVAAKIELCKPEVVCLDDDEVVVAVAPLPAVTVSSGSRLASATPRVVLASGSGQASATPPVGSSSGASRVAASKAFGWLPAPVGQRRKPTKGGPSPVWLVMQLTGAQKTSPHPTEAGKLIEKEAVRCNLPGCPLKGEIFWQRKTETSDCKQHLWHCHGLTREEIQSWKTTPSRVQELLALGTPDYTPNTPKTRSPAPVAEIKPRGKVLREIVGGRHAPTETIHMKLTRSWVRNVGVMVDANGAAERMPLGLVRFLRDYSCNTGATHCWGSSLKRRTQRDVVNGDLRKLQHPSSGAW